MIFFSMYYLWLNISKWGDVGGRRFEIGEQMCNMVKICQILDNGLRWHLAHILQDPDLSSVKTWLQKLIYMLCCLVAPLTCLQNETFNCLKHGFLAYWNSNIQI